jgi:hypothetical protein
MELNSGGRGKNIVHYRRSITDIISHEFFGEELSVPKEVFLESNLEGQNNY